MCHDLGGKNMGRWVQRVAHPACSALMVSSSQCGMHAAAPFWKLQPSGVQESRLYDLGCKRQLAYGYLRASEEVTCGSCMLGGHARVGRPAGRVGRRSCGLPEPGGACGPCMPAGMVEDSADPRAKCLRAETGEENAGQRRSGSVGRFDLGSVGEGRTGCSG